MVFMRYYSNGNLIAIFLLSLTVYYAFIWIANLVSVTYTYQTMIPLHRSPHYFLTVFLCSGTCFIVELFITGF